MLMRRSRSLTVIGLVVAALGDRAFSAPLSPNSKVAGKHIDPRVATAIEGLEVREERLRELSLTYEFRLSRFEIARVGAGEVVPGQSVFRSSNAASRELEHSRVTWARKGRKMLFDELHLLPRPHLPSRVRFVYDGEKVLTAIYNSADGTEPKVSVSDGESHRMRLVRGASQAGLLCQGKPLPDLIRARARVRCLGYEQVDRDRCLVLELQDSSPNADRARVWIDLAHGFLLRKAQRYDGPRLAVELVATNPREWAPTLFLATRVVTHIYPLVIRGRIEIPPTQHLVTVQSVQIGGLSDSLFEAAPAAGQKGFDLRTGAFFGLMPQRTPDGDVAAAADRGKALLAVRPPPAESKPGPPPEAVRSNDAECGPQCLYIICRNLVQAGGNTPAVKGWDIMGQSR
jgi:hypothetical protein